MEHTRELVLFTQGNGRALSSLVPEAMAIQMRGLWAIDNTPLALNERELLRLFSQNSRPITPQDRALRARFWLEYNRVMDFPKPRPMDMAYVISREMPKEKFYKFYVTDPLLLAYLILPPVNFTEAIQFSLDYALAQVQALLDKGCFNKDGTLNPQHTDRILRVFESLHAKVVGTRVKVGPKPKGGKEPEPEVEEIFETPAERVARMRAERDSLLAEKQSKLAVETAKPVEGTV